MEVVELVKAAGANLVGVALLVDRSGGKVDFGAKTVAVYKADVTSYEAESCPICQQGIPVTKPGSRTLK